MNTLALDRLTKSLPSLPEVVADAQRELADPNCSPQSIESVIERDSALAARVLKLANSAMFGCAFKVDSISLALTYIGLAPLRDLLLASAIARVFRNINPEKVNMSSFWRHSVACGVCARNIGKQLRRPNGEMLFLAGLLHDLGRLLMFQMLPEKMEVAMDATLQHEISCTDSEHEQFKFHHAEVAGNLLQVWKVPAAITEIVRFHHRPSAAPSQKLDATILHLSDVLADITDFSGSGEGRALLDPGADWSILDYKPFVISTALDDVSAQVDELAGMLFGDK